MGKELLEGGAPSVHIYTLNLETTAMAIVDGLNLAPKAHQQQKDYPWMKGMGNRGSKETTRPIFWAQRARSYVDRTSSWDDFPNGRFGSRESTHLHSCLLSELQLLLQSFLLRRVTLLVLPA